MVPTVLLQLINKYNENGGFILKSQKIYWFNGKRLEFWVHWPGGGSVFHYEKNLYVATSIHVMIYKNKRFNKIYLSNIWNNLLNIAHKNAIYDNDGQCALVNGCRYQCTTLRFEMFDGNLYTQLPRKQFPAFGFAMFPHKHEIYYFGTISEKYDIIAQRWTVLANIPFTYGNVYYINDCFYYMNGNSDYVYDINLDQWHQLLLA